MPHVIFTTWSSELKSRRKWLKVYVFDWLEEMEVHVAKFNESLRFIYRYIFLQMWNEIKPNALIIRKFGSFAVAKFTKFFSIDNFAKMSSTLSLLPFCSTFSLKTDFCYFEVLRFSICCIFMPLKLDKMG